ncbi:unnamed protein product [Linum trigynum]|uniref:Uncharacterized protein n=1 Tax=Linum trigynum TaxID=586398 RepID=A0AAV2E8B0_9ROSI
MYITHLERNMGCPLPPPDPCRITTPRSVVMRTLTFMSLVLMRNNIYVAVDEPEGPPLTAPVGTGDRSSTNTSIGGGAEGTSGAEVHPTITKLYQLNQQIFQQKQEILRQNTQILRQQQEQHDQHVTLSEEVTRLSDATEWLTNNMRDYWSHHN